MFMLIIAASWDILQDTLSYETELTSRPVRESMCWVCPCYGCVIPLWTDMRRCVLLCGVRIPMRWVCRSSLDWDETMCTPVWGEGAHVMGVRQTLDWVVMTCGLLPCGLKWVILEMVLQMILLWTQWDRDMLSRTTLWLSTGGRVPSDWALVDVWIPCYIVWE